MKCPLNANAYEEGLNDRNLMVCKEIANSLLSPVIEFTLSKVREPLTVHLKAEGVALQEEIRDFAEDLSSYDENEKIHILAEASTMAALYELAIKKCENMTVTLLLSRLLVRAIHLARKYDPTDGPLSEEYISDKLNEMLYHLMNCPSDGGEFYEPAKNITDFLEKELSKIAKNGLPENN